MKNEARKHELMYKYFELNLSKPTKGQIEKTILLGTECSKAQYDNNMAFLIKIQAATVDFLRNNGLEYTKIKDFRGNVDCDCDYNCECSLNEFVMPEFKRVALEFEAYVLNHSIVNKALEGYTTQEKNRFLSCNLKEVLRLKLYKGLAYLAFDHGFYDVACWHHEAAILMYGGAMTNKGFNPSEYIESELSARAKKANEARWQGHVEQLRRKYLELDKQRQSELGKKLTIKSVATWIYEHHNQDDLVYETIRDHLSKARKGEFAND